MWRLGQQVAGATTTQDVASRPGSAKRVEYVVVDQSGTQ